ncbi:hypothetical protein [Enterococcus wangshanyuanii]
MKKQQEMFAPIKERYELLNAALEPNRQIIEAVSENLRPYIEHLNSITRLINISPPVLPNFISEDTEEYDTEQVKSNIISLEDRLHDLAKEQELSDHDQKLLEKALVFISNQSSENSTELRDNSIATADPNAEIKDADADNGCNELNETGNPENEKQVVDKFPNSNPSFVEKLFSKETFQEEAISFIHQSVYNWVLLASVGKLDPLILAISVVTLLRILIPKKD